MALNFSNYQITLNEGIDTKADRKTIAAEKLLTAQNVVFTQNGVLRKRNGYEQLNTDGVSNIYRLFGFRDTLCLNNAIAISVWSETAQRFYERDVVPECTARATGVIRNPVFDTSFADSASAGGYTLTAWSTPIEQTGTIVKIFANVVDNSNGSTVLSATAVSTSTTAEYRPKCVAVGQYIFIVWLADNGADIRAVRWDSSAPTALGAEITVTTDWVPPHFDVAPLSDTQWLVVYPRYSLSDTMVEMRDTAGAVIHSSVTPGGPYGNSPIAIAANDGAVVYVAYVRTSTGHLNLFALSASDLSTVFAPVDIYSLSSPDILNLAVHVAPDSLNCMVLADIGTVTDGSILTVNVDPSGAVLNNLIYYRISMRTKPWNYGSFTYIGVNNGCLSDNYKTNASFFVVDISQDFSSSAGTLRPVATCYQRLSGVESETGWLTSVYSTDTGKFSCVVPCRFKPSQVDTLIGYNRVEIDYYSSTRALPCEFGDWTHLTGGFAFDGEWCNEMNFFAVPEASYTPSNAGGSMVAGNYAYCHVYMFTDHNGNVHRSAPSPVTVVTVGGATTGSVEMNIRPLMLTNRQTLAKGYATTPIVVETYRSTNNGTGAFYNITSLIGAPLLNAPLTGHTITDTVIDSAITSQATLYTSGESLGNYPPPPCSVMVAHKGCLFVDSLDDGSIWQSKPYISGEAIAFSEALRLLLPTSEKPTALASLDDKLVIWTLHNTYVATGDPFDDKGGGAGMQVQLVASDTGCSEPRSVVLGPDGVYFLSPKGWYLLSRGLELQCCEDPQMWVDSYDECTSACLANEYNEIRVTFRTPISGSSTLPTSQGLRLNYQQKTQLCPMGKWSTEDWSTGTLGDPITATVVNGRYYWGTSDANVYRETPGEYSDAGGWITMTVGGMVRFADLQGFARCQRFGLIGETMSDHGLEIQLAHDYSGVFTEDTLYSADELNELANEQVSHHLQNQQGQSLEWQINDYVDGDVGEGYSLSGISLWVGLKRGSFEKKMPAGAKS